MGLDPNHCIEILTAILTTAGDNIKNRGTALTAVRCRRTECRRLGGRGRLVNHACRLDDERSTSRATPSRRLDDDQHILGSTPQAASIVSSADSSRPDIHAFHTVTVHSNQKITKNNVSWQAKWISEK